MTSKKYTIKDIAKMAGVSIGTVDRVLHDRGRVSENALKKVKEVLKQIDYRPNLIARSLKTGKACKIAALIPGFHNDEYWEQATQGLEKSISVLGQYGLEVERFIFDQFDDKSFDEQYHKALASEPNGILLVPFFRSQSVKFIHQCEHKNIPVVTFNTQAEEGKVLSFIGQNLHQSGRLAARLLNITQDSQGVYLVIHIDEDIQNSIHLLDKEKGFREYFNTSPRIADNFQIINEVIDKSSIDEQLERIAKKYDTIAGVFVTSSKVYKVASYFKSLSEDIKVIGYDLIEKNLALLQETKIDFLINQNPTQQAFLGLSVLVDYLIFRKDVQSEIFLPLDVVTSENFEQYKYTQHHLEQV